LRPAAVAVGGGVTLRGSCLAPRFAIEHAVALLVIVSQADRIDAAGGDPRRRVPPERLLDIDMHVRVLSSLL